MHFMNIYIFICVLNGGQSFELDKHTEFAFPDYFDADVSVEIPPSKEFPEPCENEGIVFLNGLVLLMNLSCKKLFRLLTQM